MSAGRVAERTAQEAYQAHRVEVSTLVSDITAALELDRVAFAADGSRNWARVGTLAYIESRLLDIAQALDIRPEV